MSVTLQINTPEKAGKKYQADKVVMPVAAGNLTVISSRAPSSQVLTEGVVMLLNENNEAFKKWRIGGGLVEIAEDVCQIAAECVEEI